MLVYCSYTTY